MNVVMEEVRMSKVQLKQGDYVSTEGMAEEQYHAVARAFLEAGASPGEYPNTKEMRRLDFFGWENGFHGERALFHGCMAKDRWGDRHLSIEQVLGSEPDEEWNGEGRPPVGARVEAEESDSTRWREGVVLCHVEDPDDGAMAVISFGDDWVAANPPEVRPLRTTKERERDEMAQDLIDNQLVCTMDYAKVLAEALQEAGYRKQEDKGEDLRLAEQTLERLRRGEETTISLDDVERGLGLEDITDPANWRAGDVFRASIHSASRYPFWQADIDYVAFMSGQRGCLCVEDGDSDHRPVLNAYNNGHIRFHHRPR